MDESCTSVIICSVFLFLKALKPIFHIMKWSHTTDLYSHLQYTGMVNADIDSWLY
jgi:hypothetical protein